MVISTNQLLAELENVTIKFKNCAYISILKADNDSGKQYEIEYRLKGLRLNEKGKIEIHDKHQIAISIPFGFPNFPPNCKPLSSIFHPDIDPDAICISDYWDESKSIADLIIHLGKMVCGQKFGTTNTFNDKAAQWFKSQEKHLPFDDADLENITSPAPKSTPPAPDLPLDEIEGMTPIAPELQIDETIADEEEGTTPPPPSHPIAPELQSDETIADEAEDTAPPQPTSSPTDDPKKKDVPLKRNNRKKKWLFLAPTIIIGLLVLGSGLLLFIDLRNFSTATGHWQNIDTLLADNKLTEIEQRAKNSLDALSRIRIIKKSEKQKLTNDIYKITTDKNFKERLSGKIPYDGRYVTKAGLQYITDFDITIKKGNEAQNNKLWAEAVQIYKEAMQIAALTTEIEPAKTEQAILAQATAEANLSLEKGRHFLNQKQFDEARQHLQHATEIANTHPAAISAKLASDIHQALNKVLVLKYIKEGDGSFSAIDLDNALNSFQQALILAKKTNNPGYVSDINHSIRQIKLYQLLEKVKAAFETSEWDIAQARLEDALEFIKANKDGSKKMAANEQAIERKILQLTVLRKQEQAKINTSQNRVKEARQLTLEIITILTESPFHNDDEFRTIKKQAQTKLAYLNFLAERHSNIKYLLDNFTKIFQRYNYVARSAVLSQPQASFVKQRDRTQIFKLKCIARTITGNITLELFYQYNLDLKTWSLASGQEL